MSWKYLINKDMGIKYFFKWFKESFPTTITKPNKEFDKACNEPCLLLLDLNGIIHTSCQKIYKYGSFEPKTLLKKSPPINNGEMDQLVFEDVLKSITTLILLVNPQEVVLCIDGVAPISKQIQQRQRRFLSKKTMGGFDSNCISPGTDFLYRLGLYLKINIEKHMEKIWLSVTSVYFMDSLVPGEGEHKLFDFLRENEAQIIKKKSKIIVVGNDADLIMLSLLVSTLFLKDNCIYIIRENFVSKKIDYILVNINQLKKNIFDFSMDKPKFKKHMFDYVVCDFVILCFMVGNDFLPPIPLFNIYDGGLDLILKYYFTVPNYLTFKPKQDKIKINFKNFNGFYDHILNVVSPHAIQHYKTRECGFSNILLDIILKNETSFPGVTNHYFQSYSIHHKINKDLVKLYLSEVEWVFNYYAYGGTTVNKTMYYPSQFSPTPLDLTNFLNTHLNIQEIGVKQSDNIQIDPFFQLLCILPPHSADLLPTPLDKVLREDLHHFHPKELQIDYEGKLNEWEGVPILPPLNHQEIFKIYKENVNHCSVEDLKRNKSSKQLMISVV